MVFIFSLSIQEIKKFCTESGLTHAYSQPILFSLQPGSSLADMKRSSGNCKNLKGNKLPKDVLDPSVIDLINHGMINFFELYLYMCYKIIVFYSLKLFKLYVQYHSLSMLLHHPIRIWFFVVTCYNILIYKKDKPKIWCRSMIAATCGRSKRWSNIKFLIHLHIDLRYN